MKPLLMMMVVMAMVMVKDVRQVTGAQPTVTIGQATVYGTTVQVNNRTVERYLGLRYALSPVGPRRFAKPEAHTLTGAVNATTLPPSCPASFSILTQEEDCLFLSLYVPHTSRQSGQRTPVMVWIHGGGFVFGSGSQYDGSLLAAEGDVIVVSLNYRLGALGFLSTGDNSSVGNYGLWDQRLALQWVQDNIGLFGGNASSVTLFGESAGSASVSFHMTSPRSRALFHRAILQSGTRFSPWATVTDPSVHARVLGKRMSCPSGVSTSDLVTCLRGKPWTDMRPGAVITQKWAPVVDGDLVLPLSQAPPFEGPYIIGYNNREGGLLLPVYKRALTNVHDRTAHLTHLQQILTLTFPSLAAAASPAELTQAARIVDCMYRTTGSTASYVPDAELEAFVGDLEITLGSQQFLNGNQTSGHRFLYYFDHYPDNIKDGDKGMDHALDIEYTFGFAGGIRGPFSPFFNRTISARDRNLGVHFRALLTKFAHSGDPNLPSKVEGWPTWPAYTKGEKSYIAVTSPPRVGSHLKRDMLTVWLKTVPGVLSSQGPLGLNDTRWAACPDKTSSSVQISAGLFLVWGASLWVMHATRV